MHAGVAEADAGKRRREHHLTSGFPIGRVLHGAHEVLGDHLDGPLGPDVADRIRALVSRAHFWLVRGSALVVRHGRVGLDGVAEDVEARAGGDHRRQIARVVGVDDAERWPQCAVGDARLGVDLMQIKDGHPGRLGAGAGRGRNRNQRLELARHALASLKLVSVGSTCTLSNRTASTFAVSSASKAVMTASDEASRGSVTSITRLAPSARRSSPTSRVAPGPNLMLDASMVKMASFAM